MTMLRVSTRERLLRGAMLLALAERMPEEIRDFVSHRVVGWELVDLSLQEVDGEIARIRAGSHEAKTL